MRRQKHYFMLFGLILLTLISGIIILAFILSKSGYFNKYSIYIPSHLATKIIFTDTHSLAITPQNATHTLTPSFDNAGSILNIKFVIAGHPLLPSDETKFLTLPEYRIEASIITESTNLILINSLETIKTLVMKNSYKAILPIELMSPPLKIINYFDLNYKISTVSTSKWARTYTEKFKKNITVIGNIPKEEFITLAFVGDIMLSRRVGLTIKKMGLLYPFQKIQEELSKNDLVFGNLESVISDQGYKANQPITFRASPKTVDILKDAGFSIVSLANNHALDYGSKALLDCLKILKENGIKASGAGKNIEEASGLTYLEVNGINIGFIAYNSIPPLGLKATNNSPGVNYLNYQTIAQEISQVSKAVDLLIVSLHWGIEYQHLPSKEQEQLAQEILKSGAHIVIGHHPHVLQPVNIFSQSKIVAYSLGNFIFDQDFSEETSTGGVLLVQLHGKRVVGIEFKPTFTYQDQLNWITDQAKIEAINRLLKFQSLENINTP